MKGIPDLSHNRWLVLANVALGTFMSTLDGSIANVALPTISEKLNIPIHNVQWIVTSYLLTICALLPVMGKLSDRFGKSRVYNLGFLVFTAGSALCGFSGSLTGLILSRIVQAVGAACLMSCSQGIIAETFAGGNRGRALGITGTVVSLGSLTGPGIGGLILSSMNWNAIFLINVPIGILGFMAGFSLLPKDKIEQKKLAFDYLGSALFIIGIVTFLYAISNGEEIGWSNFFIWGSIVFSLILLVVFYFWEQKVQNPMLDFALYRIKAFGIGNMAALLSFMAHFTVVVMMPFYLQNVLGYPPQMTGYAMMTIPLVMAVVAPVSGWLSDKIDFRILTTAGLLVNVVGFALLNTLTTEVPFWAVALHLCIFGLGGGLFQSPNNSSIMGSVPKHKLGTAGGLNALVRNIGMVLGTALSVTLYSIGLNRYTGAIAPEGMLNAMKTVFWVAMGICLIALVISSLRLGSKKMES